MIERFADYIPEAWFDEGGLRRSGRLLGGVSKTAMKRMRRWRHQAKNLSVSVAISVALAAGSLAFAEGATASNALDIPVPPGMVQVAPPPGKGASIGEVNESFKKLFAAFRGGVELVNNEQTLKLAEKAAARRNERPESWARKIASDIGDAND